MPTPTLPRLQPPRSATTLLAFFLLASSPIFAEPEPTELFLLWGINGRFDGSLHVTEGTIDKVEPYSFDTPPSDLFQGGDETTLNWRSGARTGFDGLHLWVVATDKTRLRWRTDRFQRTLALADFPATGERTVPLDEEGNCLMLGRGDPGRGPETARRESMPPRVRAPQPGPTVVPVGIPAGEAKAVTIRLGEAPATAPRARRVGSDDEGRLLIQIFCSEGSLAGSAEVNSSGTTTSVERCAGGIWLAVEPRIGWLPLRVVWPDQASPLELSVPTTLVETRGRRLFVNGEPLLVKGTLPRNMNDADAAYLRSIGANAIRGKEATAAGLRHEFFVIASAHGGPGHLVMAEKSPDEASFRKNMKSYLEQMREPVREATASPYTVIVQVGNEQAKGKSTWDDHLTGLRPFARLDTLLVAAYNLVKRLDPMLPVGYANHAAGYRAPSFLDVYMHNSFMDRDRYHVDFEEFIAWQGADARPFVNTEWGANVYTPQVYHAGPNHPVLEKLHAWNYPNRWDTYLEVGTIGGTSYCMYDLPAATDQGTSRFGMLTYDRQPKLACWEAWHMWRDFELTPIDAQHLRLDYRRDCAARNCRLTLRSGDVETTASLEDFAPNESRVVAAARGESFRWTLDFTTHRGVPNQAVGAWPAKIERDDFLRSIEGRDTFPMLRELFDTEVITAQGDPAPRTLAEMTRDDGVIPVGLRKPDGTVYLTLITREAPSQGPYRESVDVELGFAGDVEEVDSTTGEPRDAFVRHQRTADGMRLLGLRAVRMPGPIGRRSDEPVELPLWKITPNK